MPDITQPGPRRALEVAGLIGKPAQKTALGEVNSISELPPGPARALAIMNAKPNLPPGEYADLAAFQAQRDWNAENRNWASRALRRGVNQAVSLGAGAMGAGGSMLGMDELRDWGFETYKDYERYAQMQPGTELGEGEGLGKIPKFGQWAIEKIIEQAPIIAVSAGTAVPATVASGAGRVAGSKLLAKVAGKYVERQVAKRVGQGATEAAIKAAEDAVMKQIGANVGIMASTGVMETGGNWAEVLDRAGVDNPYSAILTGFLSGGAEVLGGSASVIKRVLGNEEASAFRKAVKGITGAFDEGLTPDTKNWGKLRTIASKALKEAKAVGLEEAGVEMLQEVSALTNIAMNDPDFKMFTWENVKRVGESGLAGGVVGFGLGGVSGGFNNPPNPPMATDDGPNYADQGGGRNINLNEKPVEEPYTSRQLVGLSDDGLAAEQEVLRQAILKDPENQAYWQQASQLAYEQARRETAALSKEEIDNLIFEANSLTQEEINQAIRRGQIEAALYEASTVAKRSTPTELQEGTENRSPEAMERLKANLRYQQLLANIGALSDQTKALTQEEIDQLINNAQSLSKEEIDALIDDYRYQGVFNERDVNTVNAAQRATVNRTPQAKESLRQRLADQMARDMAPDPRALTQDEIDQLIADSKSLSEEEITGLVERSRYSEWWQNTLREQNLMQRGGPATSAAAAQGLRTQLIEEEATAPTRQPRQATDEQVQAELLRMESERVQGRLAENIDQIDQLNESMLFGEPQERAEAIREMKRLTREQTQIIEDQKVVDAKVEANRKAAEERAKAEEQALKQAQAQQPQETRPTEVEQTKREAEQEVEQLLADIEKREADRKAFVEENGEVEMRGKSPDSNVITFLHRVTSGKNKWRITYFDDKGPISHSEYTSYESALRDFERDVNGLENATISKSRMQQKERAKQPPAPVEKKTLPQLKHSPGKPGKVYLADGSTVDVEYTIVPVGDLVISNNTDYSVNQQYPKELQPRDRARTDMRNQVELISQNIQPERVAESSEPSPGAPIVASDSVVESGNGRALGIQIAYKSNNQTAQAYRKWLIDNAESFGLTREQVEAIEQPILVRVRKSKMQDRSKFAIVANKDTQAKMSPVQQARADSQYITDDLLAQLEPTETSGITSKRNDGFMYGLLGRLPVSEQGGLKTSDGKYNAEFVQRAIGALFYKAYQNDNLLDLVVEATQDNDIKNFINGLIVAAPEFAKARKDVKNGSVEQMVDYVSGAVLIIQNAKRDNMGLSDFLAQEQMFDSVDVRIHALARSLNHHRRSGKRIGSALTYMVQDLREQYNSKDQVELFDSGRKERSVFEIIQDAISRMESENGQDQTSETTSNRERKGVLPDAGKSRQEVRGRRQERGGEAQEKTGSEEVDVRGNVQEQAFEVETPTEPTEQTPKAKKQDQGLLSDFGLEDYRDIDSEGNEQNKLFSRRAGKRTEKGSTVAQVERFIEKLRKVFTVPIRVVQSVDDLPAGYREAAREAQRNGDIVEGMFNPDVEGGEVYLVADGIQNRRDAVLRVLRHEVEGHGGLRALLGKSFNEFLGAVYENTKYKSDIDRFAKETGLRDRLAATEEWLMLSVERGSIEKNLLRRLYNIVRRWLRSVGINLAYSENEIIDEVIVGARRAIRGHLAPKTGGSPLLSIMAMHGSGAWFDKFSTDYMGTGEGVQAFGWGLYFTSKEAIAIDYAKRIAVPKFYGFDIGGYEYKTHDEGFMTGFENSEILNIDSDILVTLTTYEKWRNSNISKPGGIDGRIKKKTLNDLEDIRDRVDKFIEYLNNSIEQYKEFGLQKRVNEQQSWIPTFESLRNEVDMIYGLVESESEIKRIEGETPPRALYKTVLHEGKDPSEYDYLSWYDKPTAKQVDKIVTGLAADGAIPSEIADAMQPGKTKKQFWAAVARIEKDNNEIPPALRALLAIKDGTPVSQIYNTYLPEILGWGRQAYATPKDVSMFLLKNGIDGIQYPANSISGKANETDKNYVVFDENAITINERIRFSKRKGATQEDFIRDPEAKRKAKERTAAFEKERGKVRDKASETPPNKVVTLTKKIGNGITRNLKKTMTFLSKALVPVSTVLENIDPALMRRVRDFVHDTRQRQRQYFEKVMPFVAEAEKKMSAVDLQDLFYCMNAQYEPGVQELVKKYGLEKQHKALREALDKERTDGTKVGYVVGYIDDYYPRRIADIDGFIEHVSKFDKNGIFDKLLREYEKKIGRPLSEHEKIDVVNKNIRHIYDVIGLGRPAQFKDRSVDFVNAELSQFYHTPFHSLIMYGSEVAQRIEARKFFGVVSSKENDALTESQVIENSIGKFVGDLMESGKITTKQQQRIQDIMSGIFGFQHTPEPWSTAKNVGYIAAMASGINSAITQLGDTSSALYLAGVEEAVKANLNAWKGQSEITAEMVGIEFGKVVEEMSDFGGLNKGVKFFFKWTGLSKMDAIGKETIMNAAINKWRKEVQAGNISADTMMRLERVFGGETDEVIKDLRSGELTENIIMLAHGLILDFQPVALSEVPELYLKLPGGRIVYQLKTFWIAQVRNTYREFVGDYIKAVRTGDLAKATAATKKLLRFTMYFMLMNGTADWLKDLITGRKTTLPEYVFDNFMNTFGMDRYMYGNLTEKGIGAAVTSQLTPPIVRMGYDVGNDVREQLSDLFGGDEVRFRDLRTAKYIPFIGKFFYYAYGRGEKYLAKEAKQDIYQQLRLYYASPKKDPENIKGLRETIKLHNQTVKREDLGEDLLIKDENLKRLRSTVQNKLKKGAGNGTTRTSSRRPQRPRRERPERPARQISTLSGRPATPSLSQMAQVA